MIKIDQSEESVRIVGCGPLLHYTNRYCTPPVFQNRFIFSFDNDILQYLVLTVNRRMSASEKDVYIFILSFCNLTHDNFNIYFCHMTTSTNNFLYSIRVYVLFH